MALPSSSIFQSVLKANKKAPFVAEGGLDDLPSPGSLFSLHPTIPLDDKAHAINAPGHIRCGGGLNGCDLGDETGHVKV
jgi:hypothetical protein